MAGLLFVSKILSSYNMASVYTVRFLSAFSFIYGQIKQSRGKNIPEQIQMRINQGHVARGLDHSHAWLKCAKVNNLLLLTWLLT